MGSQVKYKCGYRLCDKSLWGLKPKRKYCDRTHAQKERYLVNHPEARGNLIATIEKPGRGRRPKIEERICAFPSCTVSIAHRRNTAIFCEDRAHSSNRLAKLRKKQNAEKKKAYYKRHGIKFDKTVRNRNAPVTNQGVKYEGQTLLYEHYKDPLKPIEKGKGFGYYGTVALTADKELVQCHICGNLYPSVGQHLRTHKISAEKYKVMFQLAAQTALISEPIRQRYQEKVVSKLRGRGLPEWLKDYNKKVQSGEIKHVGTKRKEGGLSLEKRNELGICPDQVLEKIKDVADAIGKPPSIEDFQRVHGGRYMGTIQYLHGSWAKAVKKACGMTRDEMRIPDNERLLEDLRAFYDKHNRIPMTSDFNRGMLRNRGIYISRFGSLNNARIEAGLNAVLPMPFGQVVELTPEQYREYKSGGNPAGFAEPHQRNRRKRKPKLSSLK